MILGDVDRIDTYDIDAQCYQEGGIPGTPSAISQWVYESACAGLVGSIADSWLVRYSLHVELCSIGIEEFCALKSAMYCRSVP